MDGGESDKDEDFPSLTESIDGVRIVDSPSLFFVAFHKAFLSELNLILRFMVESGFNGSRDVVVDLGWRLEFLRVVYNYHSAAEEEVIFPALNVLVKNVVPSYSLEHISIEDYFRSIFNDLDLLSKKDGDAPRIFQKLTFSLGSLETMICQHMKKEEEQVFPLLIQKFSGEEQAQLVWRCMCIVPMALLEDLLPWMTVHLTTTEKVDFVKCIKLIVPEERLLQEAFISCLEHGENFSLEVHEIHRKGYLNGLSSFTDESMQYLCQSCRGEEHNLKDVFPLDNRGNDVPIKGITLWHASMRRDLDQVIEELYLLSSSNSNYILCLPPIILQLNFVADVLAMYGNTMEKIFYPMLRKVAKNTLSPCSSLIDKRQIRSFQNLLIPEDQGSTEMRSFMETLLQELYTFARELSEYMSFLENEVFPFISQSCTYEEQLLLIYKSLYIMPMGLLRCTVTWFCAQLSEDQSNSVLKKLNLGCPGISKPFTSLLHEWVRIGSSGKTSTAKFRKNLEETHFKNRRCYSQIMQSTMSIGELHHPNVTMKVSKSVARHLPPVFAAVTDQDMPYSNGENMQITFSKMLKSMSCFRDNDPKNICDCSKTLESRPMDHVFYIHKALINNLEYLVYLSSKLAVDDGYLGDFKDNFRFLRKIFKIHSDLEDEIVFPALELKGSLRNISGSYIIDHKLEVNHFRKISKLLCKISESSHKRSEEAQLEHYQLCLKLQDSCLSMCKVFSVHIHNEEAEIFRLFRTCFSIEEEEKIVGHMLGKTTAESLQEIILWLASYLTSDEHHALMSSWLKVSRNTKFGEWLGEWWEGITRYNAPSTVAENVSCSSLAADPLEMVSKYLLKDSSQTQKEDENSESTNLDKSQLSYGGQEGFQSQQIGRNQCEENKEKANNSCDQDEGSHVEEYKNLSHEKHPLGVNQEELEAAIRRISRDSSLDSQQKSYIIQNLLSSHWIVKQKMANKEADVENDTGEFPGQSPSFRDPLKSSFGCTHYKRNCKLLAPCCNKLYTCIRCHDDIADHPVERKAITKMMCMRCLVIQPIGPKCTTPYCQGFSMGRYYCKICKLFDDERQIYHCPYCNLCRVGKGLGVDYFHCMTCNACMSKSLLIHACREKCFEDNCPICHEYIFTSNSPVKALPCGHLMHSACFQDYTCSHYICPICSKSLGDMQVYFGMLDALLAEEKMPEDYSGQIQVILCNDCEKRGTAPFHWLYHKCPYCGSYNTRLL